MRKSIVIYETKYGISKKVAEIFSLILGAAKMVDIKDAPADITNYDNAVLIFGFCGYKTAEKMKEYLSVNKEKFLSKRVAVIGVGLSAEDLDRYADDVCKQIGKKADVTEFIQGELRVDKLTSEDKKILASFLNKVGMSLKDMGEFKVEEACNIASKCAEVLNRQSLKLGKKELMDHINEFIMQHNTCALATGTGEFVRCTPIEYMYINGAFYFISEGGFKFRGILQNPNVSISIFNNYIDMQSLASLQVSGQAEIIPCYNDEYNEVMKAKGINLKNLSNMPFDLNLIKVKVSKFEFLNSAFKKKNVDVKQTLVILP